MTELIPSFEYGIAVGVIVLLAGMLWRTQAQNQALIDRILQDQERRYLQMGETNELLRSVTLVMREVSQRSAVDEAIRRRNLGGVESSTG